VKDAPFSPPCAYSDCHRSEVDGRSSPRYFFEEQVVKTDMGETDRVDVLCAAHLEGQGQSRWSTCHLTVAAISRAGALEVTAALTEGGSYSRSQSWTYSLKFKTEHEAVERVKAIAASPADFFENGRSTGDVAKREALKTVFPGLKVKFLVDTTHGAADLAGDAITVGMGRYLAGQVERGAELTPDLSAGIERYFAKAPFSFGYWAPYKRLIKMLEAKPEVSALLAVALARVDGQLHRVANVEANEKLRPFVPTPPSDVAGPDTVAYLMRRGRRWLRRLGRNDQSAYVASAAALLGAADAQGAQARIASRWILADILYGRGSSHSNHGHGSIALPSEERRYKQRWDRYPKAWNQHVDAVVGIWRTTVHNPDIQIWAFNVLKSQLHNIPALSTDGLRLALLSPSKALQSYACAQVASKPDDLLSLDAATTQVFLEFSTPKQFAAVFPTLESRAGAKSLQDAVLAYIGEHGLPEIRRGALPSATEKRSAVLLRYSLRFLRSRLNATDTYHLARYVGQTTQFKPLAQWQETFSALPLKTLVELRLHLPHLSKSVVRSIDSVCRDAVAKGVGDESLAAALTLSPAPDLRKLGWALLANASDATVLTVWTNLIAHACTSTGREGLMEALKVKDRIERIQQHPAAAQLLSSLVITVDAADPRLAEGLLLRLAATGTSDRTLDALVRLTTLAADDAWTRQPAVLQKVIRLDPAITQLIWTSVGAETLSNLAQLHLASRSLATTMVDAIDVEEIQTLGGPRATYLAQALRSAPARLYQERGFAVSCATCPHPELQQLAIARLEARRLIATVFISLAESGMPAAVAAAERFISSIKDQTALTKVVITVCDSGVSATRAIALRLIERHPERLDLNALLLALAEHTSPDVTAVVARFAATGVAIKRDALDQFDIRVLKTRRVGRKAKELVKSRLEIPGTANAVAINSHQKVDDSRIQALVDMARGSSLRDRDWALQQLARLALDGHIVPQMQVSTTS
jgi:hypothetical protein